MKEEKENLNKIETKLEDYKKEKGFGVKEQAKEPDPFNERPFGPSFNTKKHKDEY